MPVLLLPAKMIRSNSRCLADLSNNMQVLEEAVGQGMSSAMTFLKSNCERIQYAMDAGNKPAANDITGDQQDESATALRAWGLSVGQQLEDAVMAKLMLPMSQAYEAHKRQKTVHTWPVNTDELHGILERIHHAAPGLIIQPCSSSGMVGVNLRDACELRLGYPKVFCASIALSGMGQLEACRVILDAWDRAADLDAWSSPNYQVFRRLSSLATRALTYFRRRSACLSTLGDLPNSCPESVALEDLLLWLYTYQDLFSKPCCITGKLLALDPSTLFPLPPVFRPYKLSRQQLLRAVASPMLMKAYHMHVVPEELLGWEEVTQGADSATAPT